MVSVSPLPVRSWPPGRHRSAETARRLALTGPAPRHRSTAGPEPWRWPRAVLFLPLPLLLIVQAQRQGVVSPLLDSLSPRITTVVVAAAGIAFCWVLAARLTRYGVPRLTAACTVAVPALAAYVTSPAGRWDLPVVIGLVLVTFALGGYLRFVVEAQTLGGFIAGINLALAAVINLGTLGYMAAFAAAVPFVAGRWARQVRATTAILAVLAFPSVAVYLGWLYIRWRFAGTAFGGGSGAPPPIGFSLPRGLGSAAMGLAHTPLYLAVAFGGFARFKRLNPAYLLPVPVVILLVAVGVRQPPLVINLFYTAVALTAVRVRLSRREWIALGLVAALQALLTLL